MRLDERATRRWAAFLVAWRGPWVEPLNWTDKWVLHRGWYVPANFYVPRRYRLLAVEIGPAS